MKLAAAISAMLSLSCASAVEFAVDCNSVVCTGADDVEVSDNSRGDRVVICSWDCARYGAASGRLVRVKFVAFPGECYEYAGDFVGDGECGS